MHLVEALLLELRCIGYLDARTILHADEALGAQLGHDRRHLVRVRVRVGVRVRARVRVGVRVRVRVRVWVRVRVRVRERVRA